MLKEAIVAVIFFLIGLGVHIAWTLWKEKKLCWSKHCVTAMLVAACGTAGHEYVIHLIVYSGKVLTL